MKLFSVTETAMGARAQVGAFAVALILFVIQSGFAQQVSLSSAVERSALLELRSSLGLRCKDWPIKADPCSFWNGVTCSKNGRVTVITVSGLRRTRLGRRNPRFAVDSLANFTLLSIFNASGFALPGSIPDWFGQRLGALQVLDLSSASVTGPIPQSLGNLKNLTALYLSGNGITGILPSALINITQLEILDLSRNAITGSIPSGFANLGKLKSLDLSSNFLSGPVPPGLGTLSWLKFLDLSDNSLTDLIPVQFSNLSRLVELNLTTNSLSGSLPAELRGLRSLRRMEIGDNNLEGPVPQGLFSSLVRLEVLVLSRNKFNGAIPGALWSLPSLRFLDVSRNNFTGTLLGLGSNASVRGAVFNLSSNLLYGNLTFPVGKSVSVDLSDNFFQGKVFEDSQSNSTLTGNCLQMVPNQRSLQDCRQFYGERSLTFDDFGVLQPAQPSFLEPKSKSKNRLTFILAGIFGGLGFVVILVLVLVVLLKMCNKGTNQRGSANVGPVPGDDPSLPKDLICASSRGDSFTYEQILQFTGAFSEANLIKHGHSGDIYRGSLASGTPVVIKRVNLHSLTKESYTIEMDLLGKVSHTRLVPILGHCLEHESEKLLVYKYMPNGDVASSLHRVTNLHGNLQSLDWITRLKIAIGAAEILAYLHHECSPPLVHRDVQASSILLDDKFEVRLGSLSEVHVQEGDGNQNVITRLLRKQQTSEQSPYASASAVCAYDVYCFGKVLLELVTGKLGISKSNDSSTRELLEHIVRYISIYDKELLNKIVDPSLIVDEDLLEEVWSVAIVARSCLNPKPSKRPPMRYILKALENPLKVVREESSSSGKLQTSSSRKSWSATFFASWQHSSSSESATVPGQTSKESISGLKQSGQVGGGEYSASHKRLSNEIFPEPNEIQDLERQDEH
ncbi:LOW QUALITY PROTEIN: probable LRR receptor-like serine/threonine-protein kinase At2g16250 [Pyrus x bretschneideri]|uniref:LOW QUALITY PROTEIN: probable LRR receptor-like serine/threonine-protein kinase At2g16250 n=1 Tax=Pyrus x bretschneideri TaxID=225117 RepID=UPI00202F0D8E|nr:LOW QUALITY PROTEIN: probable LRR receptor-like serine/threonine-protein kinase At2g16250 [Pyrus x bretschneideri]